MSTFNVKVRDKRTKQEMTLTVSGDHDADTARKHVENLPGSLGGKHEGFEVLSVEDAAATTGVAAETQPITVTQ
jgi:hypothetical protein